MNEAILDPRRRALENAFFIEEDRRLTRRLIEADAERAERDAITAATRITDPAVIDKFIAVGLCSTNLSALVVIPLVAVAWADGGISDKERQAVLDVAGKLKLERTTDTLALLNAWLMHRPPPELLEVWEAYTAGFADRLSASDRRELRDEVMTRAREVAEAQGGFLTFGRISTAEEAVLARIELALA